MAITAAVPTAAACGALSPEIATAHAALGDFDASLANEVRTFATAAVADLTAHDAAILSLQGVTTASDWKNSCLVASDAVIANLSSVSDTDFDGTAQGITLTAGKRVLVRTNASPDGIIATHGKYQGIYVAGTPSGGLVALTRATDADSDAEVTSGLAVTVNGGTYAGKDFLLTTADPITLGTTALTFSVIGLGVIPTPTAAAKILYDNGVTYLETNAGTAAQIPVINAGATAPVFVSVSGDATLAATGALTVAKVNNTAISATPTTGGILQATSSTTTAWTPLFAVLPVVVVAVANQATLTGLAQTIDGVALSSAGMRVYLAAQTTPAENGIWVTAAGAWTRPADWATGNTPPIGTVIRVAPGGTTNWLSSGGEWMVTATAVIDTGTVTAYPKIYKQTVTLSAGTYTIGFGSTATPDEALFLFSTTRSTVQCTRNTSGTAGGAPTLTTAYTAPVATRVAGIPGTAVIVVNAEVAAGTLNNADASTVDVLVTNW